MFHPAVPHAVPEVPQPDDSQVPVVNLRERLLTRRLVLVGGGTRSQNFSSPEVQEEQIGALALPHRSQDCREQGVRAPVDVDHQGRVAVAREADVNRGRDPRPERDAARPIFHPVSDTESVESVAGTVDPGRKPR